jgi:predicted CXXCH cytochrome family protein
VASRRPGRALVALAIVSSLPLVVVAVTRSREHVEIADARAATIPQQARDGYATSERCDACHPSQYHSWHQSFHRTMTTYATPATVKGDFREQRLVDDLYDVRLFRRGDDFFADMVDPMWQFVVDHGGQPDGPPPRVERRISMVTGSHHMQVYWVPAGTGNRQLTMPFTYLLEDQRWVSRGAVFLHPPDEHQPEQEWNSGCITCHSTGGQPHITPDGMSADSRVGEMGIACEACHGPGEAHIAANHNPLRRYWRHLVGGGDPTIVNPARLPAPRAAQVCGQCHALMEFDENAVFMGDGKKYVAGDDLEATQPLLRPTQHTPALAHHLAEDPLFLKNYFWADGTTRVSSRDYSGMIESKCMQGGKLWCGSCHEVHGDAPNNQLARGADGDSACVKCHPAIGAAVEKHTHHAAGSVGSRCYNCHMPYTVYGLLKAIRNHRIDSPTVTGPIKATGGDERPNACNLCHLDRSLAWTAGKLAAWYGKPVPPGLDDTPAGPAWLLSGDAILRAIAAWQYGWAGAQAATDVNKAVPFLVAALADPYSAVRYVAGRSLGRIDAGNQFDYVASPDARRREAAEILRRWQAAGGGGDLVSVEKSVSRLLEHRDDTRVRALE